MGFGSAFIGFLARGLKRVGSTIQLCAVFLRVYSNRLCRVLRVSYECVRLLFASLDAGPRLFFKTKAAQEILIVPTIIRDSNTNCKRQSRSSCPRMCSSEKP